MDKSHVKIPAKSPQYNDIFRRMFDVLSDSIVGYYRKFISIYTLHSILIFFNGSIFENR